MGDQRKEAIMKNESQNTGRPSGEGVGAPAMPRSQTAGGRAGPARPDSPRPQSLACLGSPTDRRAARCGAPELRTYQLACSPALADLALRVTRLRHCTRQPQSSRPKSALIDRMDWARSYVKPAKALDSSRRGLFVVGMWCRHPQARFASALAMALTQTSVGAIVWRMRAKFTSRSQIRRPDHIW